MQAAPPPPSLPHRGGGEGQCCGDIHVALVAAVEDAELYLYPGKAHLFTDSSLAALRHPKKPKTYPPPPKPPAYSLHLPGCGRRCSDERPEASRGRGGRAPLRVERTSPSGGRYGKRWGLRSRRPRKSWHPEAVSVSFLIPYEANAVSGSVRLFDNRARRRFVMREISRAPSKPPRAVRRDSEGRLIWPLHRERRHYA